VDYLQDLSRLVQKTALMNKQPNLVAQDIKKLSFEKMCMLYEHLDGLITHISEIFVNKEFCLKTRLFQNLVYMVFLDFIKIYNTFYILVTELLHRFKNMNYRDMEKTLQIYKNFLNFVRAVDTEMKSIPLTFGFTFKKPNLYVPSDKHTRAMERMVEAKKSGGDVYEDDYVTIPKQKQAGPDFGEDVYEDRHQFAQDDDEDSDDDIEGLDILADEKMNYATHAAPTGGRRTMVSRV
jgi:hypothetical protein